ncbi:MAG: response regulator transcription factor [Peptoniphilaceae bacterium]|nr:response regulator transcription factor [Peptoniphilaceae bacterium]MDY6085277.1 response regulator transcription factor [Peptoniphilaceae bacterium]
MRLLLIHPNTTMMASLAESLSYDGWEVIQASTLKKARERMEQGGIDFCLIHEGVPDGNVLDFHSQFEQQDYIPAIVLTEKPSVRQTVLFLEYGYDDVVPGDVDFMELKARMRARMRQRLQKAESTNPFIYDMGAFKFDLMRRLVQTETQSAQFTCKEFEVLLLLVQETGRVLDRDTISLALWQEPDTKDRTVDVYIRRIRDKLSALGLDELIETKWGAGYYFRPVDQARELWETLKAPVKPKRERP